MRMAAVVALVSVTFTSRPLARAETNAEFYAGKDKAIEVVGSRVWPRGRRAGPVDVTVEREVKPGLYSASYTLD